jgi:hypothetical protein
MIKSKFYWSCENICKSSNNYRIRLTINVLIWGSVSIYLMASMMVRMRIASSLPSNVPEQVSRTPWRFLCSFEVPVDGNWWGRLKTANCNCMKQSHWYRCAFCSPIDAKSLQRWILHFYFRYLATLSPPHFRKPLKQSDSLFLLDWNSNIPVAWWKGLWKSVLSGHFYRIWKIYVFQTVRFFMVRIHTHHTARWWSHTNTANSMLLCLC